MAAITDAILSQDKSSELKDECSAHLDTLMALAQAKSHYYAEKIQYALLNAGKGNDQTFPITKIEEYTYETKAYTSDNSKNIQNLVSNAITGFVDGKTVPTLTTMLSGFIETLFGSTEGVETEINRYRVILEGVSITRFDFYGWARSVKSNHLKGKCDKVSAFILYKSIVDMRKVLFNDFLSIYQYTINAEDSKLSTAEIVKKCKEIYHLFHPEPDTKSNQYPIFNIPFLSGEINYPINKYQSFDIFKENLTIL